jgi:chromosome segregation ATPase
MDLELKAYLDTHFARMGERIESRLDGMDVRLDGMDARLSGVETRLDRLEDEVRQTRILVEGQRDDTRQIAEGIIGTNERLEAFRAELKVHIDQVPSLISLPYVVMDGRVKTLESWKERTDRDPVEIVRERWGRPKAT